MLLIRYGVMEGVGDATAGLFEGEVGFGRRES